MTYLDMSIGFPKLGITIDNLPKNINVFGISIAFYGIIISIGILTGYLLAQLQAKRTKQSAEVYLDYAMYLIVASILGARAYYVIFSWDYYKEDLIQILNFRAGGLAIYGGIIAGFITTVIFAKVKKLSFLLMGDTVCAGLAMGQAIGRWGNFFNREAFGRYTDSLFTMQLKVTEVSQSVLKNNQEYIDKMVNINGTDYIQVHPTFLYESVSCLLIAIIILVLTKYRKCNGQLLGVYMICYGMVRFFIEGLRTDQLLLWNTNIAVSQIVSLCVVAGGILIEIRCLYLIKNGKGIVKDKAKKEEN